ncbi:anti-anti-sigma factor [Maricaulis sp. W15]|uniref:Anti-sigma-factor antagonist n=1 Tax=Maricaulis maris TaxID=74318 RepID=A0A495D3I8_9PROT|nr:MULTISPECIES: STAS domain-containing protein [Maricaulis]OLF81122.1 anti-anti-sigma factor [Maricaulis sp. W15]RKQ96475.1 anti-sigma-factor antagonist [Maricaulis maris]
MDYRCETRGDRFLVSISGVLTFDDHEKFRQVVAEIADCAPATVELSLATTRMIDSAGIGMLLLANDKAGRCGKSLRLSGVTGHVAKVIELSKIDQLIPVD